MEPITEIMVSCQGATTVLLDELRELQGELKDLTEENYVKLRNSLVKFGFSFPIFMWQDNEGTKWVVDAHQRLRTLRKMRSEGISVPALPADYIHAKDKIEAKEKLLLLNSQYGHMTQEGFDAFTADIPMDDISDLLALDNVMFEGMGGEKEVVEDGAPQVDETQTISQLGEVYQLGRHRLMCGDATNIEHAKILLQGLQPSMVFTDPPYGVDYQLRVDEGIRKDWGGIQNDDLKGEALQQFLKDSVGIYGQTKYICCNWQSVIDFWQAYGRPNSLIVWDKGSIGMGAGYRNQHELILFYGKLDHNSESNVWSIQRDSAIEYTHPTQKPIAIPFRAIKNSSNEGDIVLDVFGGSGPTLIACEQTNRTCYMMELDPKYCDVIRKRYAKFINQEAEWQEVTPAII